MAVHDLKHCGWLDERPSSELWSCWVCLIHKLWWVLKKICITCVRRKRVAGAVERTHACGAGRVGEDGNVSHLRCSGEGCASRGVGAKVCITCTDCVKMLEVQPTRRCGERLEDCRLFCFSFCSPQLMRACWHELTQLSQLYSFVPLLFCTRLTNFCVSGCVAWPHGRVEVALG